MKGRTILQALLAASVMALGAGANAATHHYVVGSADFDHDGIANRYDRDRDGDGIPNARDPQPNHFNMVTVSRRHHRNDRDGDGILNWRDPHPDRFDRVVARRGPRGDMDRDGIQNRYDRDRDGDGVRNARDRFPANPRRS